VPNCKYFLVTETKRKHARLRARFQQQGDANSHQVSFFLQGKAPKEIHAILTETLKDHAPSYATVKNWMTHFKRGYFPPVMRLFLDDPEQLPPRGYCLNSRANHGRPPGFG